MKTKILAVLVLMQFFAIGAMGLWQFRYNREEQRKLLLAQNDESRLQNIQSQLQHEKWELLKKLEKTNKALAVYEAHTNPFEDLIPKKPQPKSQPNYIIVQPPPIPSQNDDFWARQEREEARKQEQENREREIRALENMARAMEYPPPVFINE